MLTVHKKIVTDENMRPVAVQIDYNDWLEIERLLENASNTRQPASSHLDLRQSPLFGLWRDREDCRDVQAFVDSLRQGRF